MKKLLLLSLACIMMLGSFSLSASCRAGDYGLGGACIAKELLPRKYPEIKGCLEREEIQEALTAGINNFSNQGSFTVLSLYETLFEIDATLGMLIRQHGKSYLQKIGKEGLSEAKSNQKVGDMQYCVDKMIRPHDKKGANEAAKIFNVLANLGLMSETLKEYGTISSYRAEEIMNTLENAYTYILRVAFGTASPSYKLETLIKEISGKCQRKSYITSSAKRRIDADMDKKITAMTRDLFPNYSALEQSIVR